MGKHCYHACGVTFSSELTLPGVTPPNAGQQVAASVYFGSVPSELDGTVDSGACFDASPDRLLLKSPVGRYLIQYGREIVIDPEPQATEGDLRVFLMGSAFGALLHQREIVPLHASCVRVGDGCVAFCGESGAGKSTLAAFMQARGYDVLGDDICPIRILPGLGAVVSPGFARVRLWEEAVSALGLDTGDLLQPRKDLKKYEMEVQTRRSLPLFLPLLRVYHLLESTDAHQQPLGAFPARGAFGLSMLLANTYRFRYLRGLGLSAKHLQTCTRVLDTTDTFWLWRLRKLERIGDSIDDLEEHLEGIAPGPVCSAAVA